MQYQQQATAAQPLRAKTIRDNAEAGLGVGSVLLGGGLAVGMIAQTQGLDLWSYAGPWAGLSVAGGLVYFGWLSAWRNSIDEWQASMERRKLIRYAEWATARIEELRQQVHAMRDRAEQAEAQQHTSRAQAERAVIAGVDIRDIDDAERYALRLVRMAAQGSSYSRDKSGMTKAQWTSGAELLARAGCAYWQQVGNTNRLTIIGNGDMTTTENRLGERADLEREDRAQGRVSGDWPLFMSNNSGGVMSNSFRPEMRPDVRTPEVEPDF